jgi:hypothetical protein
MAQPKALDVTCQCGSVNFTTPEATPVVFFCHCTECQRQSSSVHGVSAVYAADFLFPLAPDLEAKLTRWSRPTESGNTMHCWFCKTCGSRMFHRLADNEGNFRATVSVKGGVIKGLDLSAAKHIYTSTAVVPIPGDAESYEGAPDHYPGRDGTK